MFFPKNDGNLGDVSGELDWIRAFTVIYVLFIEMVEELDGIYRDVANTIKTL